MIYIGEKGKTPDLKNERGVLTVKSYDHAARQAIYNYYNRLCIQRTEANFDQDLGVYYFNNNNGVRFPSFKVEGDTIYVNKDIPKKSPLIRKAISSVVFNAENNHLKVKYVEKSFLTQGFINKPADPSLIDEDEQQKLLKRFKNYVVRKRYLESKVDNLKKIEDLYE